jgi:hypothetical protein
MARKRPERLRNVAARETSRAAAGCHYRAARALEQRSAVLAGVGADVDAEADVVGRQSRDERGFARVLERAHVPVTAREHRHAQQRVVDSLSPRPGERRDVRRFREPLQVSNHRALFM